MERQFLLIPARLGITGDMGSLQHHRGPGINGSKDVAVIRNHLEHMPGKTPPTGEEPGLATGTRLPVLD